MSIRILTYAAAGTALVIFSSAACGSAGSSSKSPTSAPSTSVNIADPAGLSPMAACTAFFSEDSSLMSSIASDAISVDTATTDATYYSTLDFGLATYAARNSAADTGQIQTLRTDAQTISTALRGIADFVPNSADMMAGTEKAAAYTRLEFAHSQFQKDCDAVVPNPPE